MNSFSPSTLLPIDGDQALAEAVRTVLFTPVGTRVMRRDFGSLLLELIDQPQNQETVVSLYGATALALMRWLPVFRLAKVVLEHLAPGRAQLLLEGADRSSPAPNALIRIAVPLSLRAGSGSAIPQPA